jgi:hypothetical protein
MLDGAMGQGPFHVSAVQGSTAKDTFQVTGGGGHVRLNSADGSVTYDPPPGFDGADTFTYQISNTSATSAPASVVVTMSDMMWFVCNGCPGASRGTLLDPFTSIGAFSAANTGAAPAPQPGQKIFIRSGTYSGATDTLKLQTGQIVLGQGAAATSIITPAPNTDPTALATVTAGARPVLSLTAPTSGNAIDVASGNTISFLNVGTTLPNAAYISGSSVGNLTLSNMTLGLDATSQGRPLVLSAGTLTATLDAINSKASSGGAALSLTTVGGTLTINGGSLVGATGGAVQVSNNTSNLAFTYAGSVSNAVSGTSIAVSGNTGGTLNFTGTVELGSNSAPAVNISNNSGTTINFSPAGSGALNIASTVSGDGFVATGGGTVTVTGSNNKIATQSGTALNVTNTAIGTAGMTFVSISAGTGLAGPTNGITLNNTGTTGRLTVTGAASASNSGGVIQHTGGAAVSLNNTVNVQLQFMELQNAAGAGVSVDTEGTANATVTVDHGTFTDNQQGIKCLNAGNNQSSTTCNISNNTFTGQTVGSILVQNGSAATCSGSSPAGASLTARIQTNSASQSATGINPLPQVIGVTLGGCNTQSFILIDNNTVVNNGTGTGISVSGTTPSAGTTPGAAVGITNNTVTMSASGGNGLDLNLGATSQFGTCFRVGTTQVAGVGGPNSFPTSGGAGTFAISLAQAGQATVDLEASKPTPPGGVFTDAAAALSSKNGDIAVSRINVVGSITLINDGFCTVPTPV